MKEDNLLVYPLKINKKWFTLIELIVVITVLAILWTIAFLSLQWYSRDSRNSLRIQDFSNINKSLEIFISLKWFYPEPTDMTDITYSWAVLWTQWNFWDKTVKNLDTFNKKPLDPLTNTEYTYSVTKLRNEYMLWWIKESWDVVLNIIPQTQATEKLRALTKWTYNWKLLKTSTWWVDYILAIPSIITTDTTNTNIEDILNNKELVYDDYNNLPKSYKDSWYEIKWWFDYTSTNLIAYSWSLQDLKDESELLKFVYWLKKAYVWTILQDKDEFISFKDLDIVNKKVKSKNIVINYINSGIWGLPKIKGLKLDDTCFWEKASWPWCFAASDIEWLTLWYDFADKSSMTIVNWRIQSIKDKSWNGNDLWWNHNKPLILDNWKNNLPVASFDSNNLQSLDIWKTVVIKEVYTIQNLLRSSSMWTWFVSNNWLDNWHLFRKYLWTTQYSLPGDYNDWFTNSGDYSVDGWWYTSSYIDENWHLLRWTSGVDRVIDIEIWSTNNWRSSIWYFWEFFAFSSSLDLTSREKLEWYLACKWWLQSNLPSSHTYKIFCPK